MDPTCHEVINYDGIKGGDNNVSDLKETKELRNLGNLFKNKNNRRVHNRSKYKIIEGKNIIYGNFRRNEQILMNDENLLRNFISRKCENGVNL